MASCHQTLKKGDAKWGISVYLVMGLGRKVHFSQRMRRVTEMMSAPATPNTVLLVSRLKQFNRRIILYFFYILCSALLHLPPLPILGLNLGLLRLSHRQSDDVTQCCNHSARSHRRSTIGHKATNVTKGHKLEIIILVLHILALQ